MRRRQKTPMLAGGVQGAKAVTLGDLDEFMDWLVSGEGTNAQELYAAVSWCFWCANLRASSLASVPYDIYPMELDEDDEDKDNAIEWPYDLETILWDTEAWIVSVGARGSVNESEPFLVTIDVVRGDDMLDYVWLGTLVLEVVDVATFQTQRQSVELATGGEARTHVFDLLLTEPGVYVLRATLYRQDDTVMDTEEASVTVEGVTGPDVPDGRRSSRQVAAVF